MGLLGKKFKGAIQIYRRPGVEYLGNSYLYMGLYGTQCTNARWC